MDNNEFGFDAPEVNEDTFHEDRKASYPHAMWQGKAGVHDMGFWSIDQSLIDVCPEGWREHEMRFGVNPNDPMTPVYVTRRLRCVPIAVRARWIIESDDGKRHHVPWFMRRDKRPEGKKTGHIQVMVVVPGLDEPIMLALKGYTRTMAWNNNNTKGHDFPLGVETVLRDYAKRAQQWQKQNRNYAGPDLPWLCMWSVDLIPNAVVEDGENKAIWTEVNPTEQVFMNVFVADMSIGGNGLPKSRYVGPELFQQYEELRENEGISWEKDWQEQYTVDVDDEDFEDPNAVPVVEDEEIPF